MNPPADPQVQPGDDGGTATSAAPNAPVVSQQTLPGVDVDWQAKAKAAEDELAKRKKAEKDAKAKADAEEKAKKDQDELERGEAKKVVAAKEQELEEARKRISEFETAMRERIESKIERLDEGAKKEIEILGDDVPLHKLETLVDAKLSSVQQPSGYTAAPPAPGVRNSGTRKEKGHQIHSETKMVLEKVGRAGDEMHTASRLGAFDAGTRGEKKFRWRGTGDDTRDVMSFISLLKSIAQDPGRDARNEARKRAFGDG